MFNCQFCGRESKSVSGLGVHQKFCKSNPKRVERKSYAPWNKGLSKTDERIQRHAETLRSGFASGRLKTIISEEGRQKLSESAKARGLGGYRPHPNRGKRYKGVWFDSNWEVAVAKSLDESNVRWERPRDGFVWTDAGNKYYPDFFLPEHNVYLDPKNSYLRIKDAEKVEQSEIRNGIRVLMLDETQLSWQVISKLV